jgi:two-component system phosphate regulon sensor histidine kinase PhoR
MFASKLQIRLPRRITAYFLLFALTALVWLGAGAIYIARSINETRSESASLRWLGRTGDRLALAYLRDSKADLHRILADMRLQSGALYCAIVSPTGEYMAHSSSELAGQPALERGGTTDRWGEVVRVQYVDSDGMPIHEYRSPLQAGKTKLGTLRLGIAQPGVWSYIRIGSRLAPLAFLGPACCLGVGAVLLNRLVRPVAEIEHQLFQVAMSPSVDSCELREVPSVGAAAIGWNRVIQQRSAVPQSESLRERVRRSIQQGRHSQLDAVLNSIPEGIATTDSDGCIIYANTPMAVMLELECEVSLDGQKDWSASAAHMIEQLARRWQVADDNPLLLEENRGRPVVIELVGEEQGQRRVLRVARYPILAGDSGHFDSHVWTLRDVTQQKLAEEMRDQFVDTATHELRTPLANIKAYAETLALADVIDIEQQKQFLNTINSEATRLARFVDDLLSVSSMELGSLSLNKQVTELSRMLNEVITKIRPQIDEKDLTLEVVLPEKLPEPEIDKDKIATVLVNLLGNAIKYTPPGGRVTFRVNVTDQQIEISVEDTGVGIAKEEIPKVFEKFFRSSDPRVQEQTGTGIGLALAQEVVRLHGGRINVESELDKGSTFSVVLPLG